MTDTTKSNLIPVTLLTGFLGSGKTTILNHLVQQPEMADTLVIINEFGEMALDHLLIAHSTENLVMEMSSGCVCCTIRGDLVKTLRDISWRFSRKGERQFNRVLIETTGLADPSPIIHTLMTHAQIAPRYRLDGIVATVDIETGQNNLNSFKEAVKQVAVADVLLMTKSDLSSTHNAQNLEKRLRNINPAATYWKVENGKVDAQQILNLGLFTGAGEKPDVSRWLRESTYRISSPLKQGNESFSLRRESGDESQKTRDVNRHDDNIRAFCFAVDSPIPETVLTLWLETLMSFVGRDILRVKGILNIEGRASPVVLHGVQHIFHPPVTLPGWPDEDRRSKLVFITNGVDQHTIEGTLDSLKQALYSTNSHQSEILK